MPNAVLAASVPQTALVVETVGGEPRILDTDLARRLGFAKPAKIRDLIKRHLPSLEAMGTVPTVGTVNRGQEATEFYLNRKQAIFITAKSETAEAVNITIEIVQRFEAYERGAIAAAPGLDFSNPDHLLPLLAQYATDKKALQNQVAANRPKVLGFERIAGADGSMSITEAAKTLQLARIKDLFDWLHAHRWIYRRAGNKNWLAHQDKVRAGLLEHKVTTVTDAGTGDDKVVEQVRITSKGLARLADLFTAVPARAATA